MQVKIADATPAPAFNLTALNNAFKHHADGSGVFEAGQHPIIVGQAAYNSAYGTNFAGDRRLHHPAGTTRCDGFARINEQGRDLSGSTRCWAEPEAEDPAPAQGASTTR